MTRVLVLLLIVVSLGIAVGESLPDDSALDAPVTLAVKGEALTDVLKMMQEQTGVRLQAGHDVADQKVTIFVDDKPLRKVMEGLSVLLEYHWTTKTLSSKKVYEIWEDEKTRLAREDWYTKALEKAWEEADADLQHMLEYSSMTEEQLQDRRQELTAKLSQGSDSAARKESVLLSDFMDNPSIVPAVQVYRSFSPEALRAFRAGMTVYLDSLSSEDAWLVPDGAARKLIELDPTIMTVNGKPVYGDSINLEYHSSANVESVYAGAALKVRRSANLSMNQITFFAKRLADAYALPENHLPKSEIGDKKVSWELGDLAKEASLPIEQTDQSMAVANRSDILALLHQRLGTQIIADHYSEWSSWSAAKDRPLKEILASFEKMRDHSMRNLCEAYSGFDGDFLYMRARDVRLCNLREIPNRLLRPWQAAYAKQGCLGLNELGEIAQLSEDQMPGTDSRLLGIGGAPATSPVLKLYGMLTQKQRKEAFSGGTGVSAFTPAQRAALIELLPTQKSKQPVNGILVGIYKDGWRVDKEEPAPVSAGLRPVAVVMDDQTTSERYSYEVTTSDGSSTAEIPAKTIDEAWEMLKSSNPDAGKENLIWVQSRRIKATVTFADGSSTAKSVDIPSRIPYSRVKE